MNEEFTSWSKVLMSLRRSINIISNDLLPCPIHGYINVHMALSFLRPEQGKSPASVLLTVIWYLLMFLNNQYGQ